MNVFLQYGLYSAFIGCFVYVFLGSTMAVTIGPTALLSLLSYEAVTSLGPGAAVLLAFLSGCLDLAMGLLNLGTPLPSEDTNQTENEFCVTLGILIDFIATPVIAGFTSSSAITIATTQVKSLLGLQFSADGFIDTWTAIFEHIAETRPWDAIMGFASILALIVLRVNNSDTYEHINYS